MKEKVQFAKPIISEGALENIKVALSSGQLSHGPFIKSFEKQFSSFVNAESAVAVSSCTTGLNICYRDCGVAPGTEVIVPALTHVATAHAAAYLGARIRFADVDPKTGLIVVDSVKKLINSRTVAICVVHFLGALAPINELRDITENLGITIIEDCAVALGTHVNSSHVGLIGDYGCFSFYPTKHITSGEGGMVISKDSDRLSRVRKLRSFGYTADLNERKVPGVYDIAELGYNYRMSELSAALAVSQMDEIDILLRKRYENYKFYENYFSETGIQYIDTLCQPIETSPYLFNIIVKSRVERDNMLMQLLEQGIQLSVHYPISLNKSIYYSDKNQDDCPIAEQLANCMLSLPTGPHMTQNQLEIVANSIKKLVKNV